MGRDADGLIAPEPTLRDEKKKTLLELPIQGLDISTKMAYE